MAEETKDLLPSMVAQNPAPAGEDSQDRKQKVRDQADRIMEVFYLLLPSNYVSQVRGPFYSIQFQAAAEVLANFQITAQEIFADASFSYTRTEYLYQILGSLVFPVANEKGWPTIEGDVTYRTFLRNMINLLLQGATAETVQDGIELLTDATIEVIEKGVEARKTPNSAWGPQDQFVFEINVSDTGTVTSNGVLIESQAFPVDPFTLYENVRIVLRALKPAHTLYDYRHLFTESFGPFFSASLSWDMENYYYQDFRGYCVGAKKLIGTTGVTLTDRTLFSDAARDFSSLSPGAILTILSGVNSIHAGGTEGTSASTDEGYVGRYRVVAVLYFPVGDDATPRAYTTTSGLSGTATVSGNTIEDSSQNWALALEGEILTFSSGPNAGSYRLKFLEGNNGGPVGFASGPATKVGIAPSLLRLRRRMKYAATGQSYEVTVDRLGKQTTREVTGEDVTLYFLT